MNPQDRKVHSHVLLHGATSFPQSGKLQRPYRQASACCLRQFLRRSSSAGAQQAAVAGDRHLGDWLKGQPDVVMIRSRFVAKRAGDGRDDALRAVVLDLLQVLLLMRVEGVKKVYTSSAIFADDERMWTLRRCNAEMLLHVVICFAFAQGAESVRKSDVQKAVKAAGVDWVDTAYNRVMKAIGKNAGGAWTLQEGDIVLR